MDIEGLDEMVDELHRAQRVLPQVFRDVLAGEGGDVIAEVAAQKTPKRTGTLARSIRVQTLPSLGWQSAGAVVVAPVGKHPKSSSSRGEAYDNATVSTWVESGSKPHDINPGARTGRSRSRKGGYDRNERAGLLLPGGQFRSHVLHPGFRGKRVMSRTIRAARVKRTIEAAVVAELTKRLELQAGGR